MSMILKNIIDENRITVEQINADRDLYQFDLAVEGMRTDGTIIAGCIFKGANPLTARVRKYVAITGDGLVIEDTHL